MKEKKGKRKVKKKGPNYVAFGIVIVLLVVAVIFFMKGGSKTSVDREAVDTFAKCLTEKGAVMYGAFWCPHCARTKKNFGDSFEHINYVECDPRGPDEQSELCLEKDIQAYDTWEFADETRLIGEPSFEALSKKTGCAQP